ncbi:MAG: undecaprenyl-diphosphate phosphatase [Clostridiales bacterium]|nr:undecaprenyl-diphosphate phosphatase [Clostridiales bacterium]
MILKAIILGIIEGLTEFLPISSTGHLIIANKYLDFTGEFSNLFSVVIQSGAILAVILYFRRKIFPENLHKESLIKFYKLWSRVLIAIIPAGVLGIMFDDKIEALLFSPKPVAVALIVGAIAIILVENKKLPVVVNDELEMTYLDAFIVGAFQTLALIPGMSRSASTIIGGRIKGFSRKVAAEFSFFLAIPTLLGASLIKLVKTDMHITYNDYMLLLVGTFVSFIVAYIVIAAFMNYIKTRDFKVFAYYRIVLGIILLIIL